MNRSAGTNSAKTNTDVPERGEIPDVQGSLDLRQIPIQKVGIKGIRHPIQVRDRANSVQHTIATFNMYVNLPHNFKGTHMSRFVEILNNHEYEITVESFMRMLFEMTEILDAKSGQIEMSFPYFVNKVAPISKVRSLMDYGVTLTGKLYNNTPNLYIKVVVPITSLCPCSKEISDYGAHNQRSHATIEVRTRTFVWIEEIIDLVENEASSQLYGLLKRRDEKFVTEHAFNNPKFVEDMVRDVAQKLNQDDRIDSYVVESENFESIHNHSAYALVEKDKLVS
uniref:GTP cyclohydrolase FolE2 n=1 Tax=Candidatus Kentrum sp. TUN TaxID=2126343 RepID=A0A451A6I8_9GAMM|nr:MAG: GTP cyclohydrolase I [Candidatus Kentron sp. TUN]VFK55509.1 MAG: GTP cyclohydrolase I [Candidatus Kentron sp. TUN]VFK61644.1 MAG: GTP cyclohydrolase I [Candidatus Kentron sp. TUN]